MPFNMYPFQEKLIQNFHDNRFNICKMPRQTGKSTTCVSYLSKHYAVFNDNVNVAILANKASTAQDLLEGYNLPTKTCQNGCSRVSYHGINVRSNWKMGPKFQQTLLLHLLSEADPIMSSFLTSSRSSRITLLMTSLPLFILLFLLTRFQK